MIETVRPDKRMAGVLWPLRWEAQSPGGAGLVLTTLEGTGGNGEHCPPVHCRAIPLVLQRQA